MSESKKRAPSPGKKSKKTPQKTQKEKKVKSKSDQAIVPSSESGVGSLDFEAGLLFSRYDSSNTGVLTAEDFRKMWRDSRGRDVAGPQAHLSVPSKDQITAVNFPDLLDESKLSFEAGKVFSKFDQDGDGRITKQEFESLFKKHPEIRLGGYSGLSGDFGVNKSGHSYNNGSTNIINGGGINGGGGNGTTIGGSSTMPLFERNKYPFEVISGKLLTHYDETAGVAIPSSDVEQHKQIGNTVVPLIESYKIRYDRLRALLTSKLLPRRENLLQIHRHLKQLSEEIRSTRTTIEKETTLDAEQIIERLRAVESHRQSSVTHQVLRIEEELDSIERIAKRIEIANESSSDKLTSLVLTSASPGLFSLDSNRQPKPLLMIELIQQFGDIFAKIDSISQKPIPIPAEIKPDDFPRETSERLTILNRCDRFSHALNIKDHMLWTCIQEKNKAEELLEEERKLCREYAHEVSNWANATQQLSQEIEKTKSENESLKRRLSEATDTLLRHKIIVNRPEV